MFDDAEKNRTNISKYCWIHRAYNHIASKCHYYTRGHIIEATFTNKKGGIKARSS